MKQIDHRTHKVTNDNYYNSSHKKNQIIISFSLRKDSFHINRLKHKEYGKSKKWNTYTITREGLIYEHYNSKYYSDFIGIKDIDKKSISIVLENMGTLIKNERGEYVNFLDEVCPKKNIIEKNWMGQKYWEFFPEEQIESTINLCKNLCKKHNIPNKIIDFHHYHVDISKFKGIALKTNFFNDSYHINPLFDLIKFSEELK